MLLLKTQLTSTRSRITRCVVVALTISAPAESGVETERSVPRATSTLANDRIDDPVTVESMGGEWTGIGVEDDVLVTLRVSDGGTVLSVSELANEVVTTRVYTVANLKIEKGRFSIGHVNSELQLQGEARRSSESGWGHGWLKTKWHSLGDKRVELYFFYMVDQSWVRRMLDLYQDAEASSAARH